MNLNRIVLPLVLALIATLTTTGCRYNYDYKTTELPHPATTSHPTPPPDLNTKPISQPESNPTTTSTPAPYVTGPIATSTMVGCAIAELELNFWWNLRIGRGPEIRLILKPQCPGIKNRGEGFDGRIVALNGAIEIAAFHADAVFGAFQLRLQLPKAFGCCQIRIALNDHQQTRQGGRKLSLGLIKGS